MIVFASSLRNARRPRRIPSVASLVRVLGTVRVSDQPVTWSGCSAPAAPRSLRGSMTPTHGGHSHVDTDPWSS